MSNSTIEPPLAQPYYGAPIGAAVKRFFKKYATFSGRASRSEFWWWVLVMFIVGGVLNVLAAATGGAGTVDEYGMMATPSGVGLVFYIVYIIWSLATIVPYLALVVRRLHDSDKSGFWIFIGLVPLVGGIVLFVFMLMGPKPEGARFDR